MSRSAARGAANSSVRLLCLLVAALATAGSSLAGVNSPAATGTAPPASLAGSAAPGRAAASRRTPNPVLLGIFQRLDTDHDGRLSPAEIQRVITDPERAPKDLDGDGYVSEAEFEDAFFHVYEWRPSDRSLLAYRFVSEGRRLLRDGFIDSALSVARSAIRSYPEWADNWILLGDISSAVGRREEAIAAYRKALELSPNCDDALFALAVCLPPRGAQGGQEGLLRRALEILERKLLLLGFDGTSPAKTVDLEAYLCDLTTRFLDGRQPALALELVRWAHENLGRRPRLEALGLMAQALAGQPTQALAEIQLRASKEEGKFYYLQFQARILMFMGFPQDAKQCYRKALAVAGDPIDRRMAMLDLVGLLAMTGENAAAKRMATKLIPQMNTPALELIAARTMAGIGMLEPAIELTRAAAVVATNAPGIWTSLAQLYACLGDRDGYVGILQATLGYCTGSPDFREQARGLLSRAMDGADLPVSQGSVCGGGMPDAMGMPGTRGPFSVEGTVVQGPAGQPDFSGPAGMFYPPGWGVPNGAQAPGWQGPGTPALSARP